MPTFQLLGGARGVDLPGGRSIQADRHGRVIVDDAAARQIRGSAAMRRYDAVLEVIPGGSLAKATDYVHVCGFTPWPWQDVCPRCGGELPSREEA
jgi:hypothetical protein